MPQMKDITPLGVFRHYNILGQNISNPVVVEASIESRLSRMHVATSPKESVK